MLEESGLRKDHEYFIQSSYRTEAGDLKRPDVIIRLPDNKDVVVDSKVSLNAYEEALAVDDDQERDALLKQYLMNMKNHVKRLSSQDYDRLEDVRSLDFVLLFVPIESAFTLAMQTDHNLFTEAFSKTNCDRESHDTDDDPEDYPKCVELRKTKQKYPGNRQESGRAL